MTDFNIFIAEFKAGRLNELLTQELAELTKAVESHHKAGELDLKIKITPRTEGEIQITVRISSKAPRRDTLESVAFVSPDGNILTHDPKQQQLFEKNVVRVVHAENQKISK